MPDPRPRPRDPALAPAAEPGGPPGRGARRKRFTPEAIAAAVRELESGVPAPIVCRRFGVSDRTLYRWRRRADAPRPAAGAGGE